MRKTKTIFGTQFCPTQTWWECGGAAEFFAYVSRCSALLQQADVVCDMTDARPTLHVLSPDAQIEWLHKRADDGSEYFFVSNRKPEAGQVTLRLDVTGRMPERWDAKYATIADCGNWSQDAASTEVTLDLEAGGYAFVMFRRPYTGKGMQTASSQPVQSVPLPEGWTLRFPPG